MNVKHNLTKTILLEANILTFKYVIIYKILISWISLVSFIKLKNQIGIIYFLKFWCQIIKIKFLLEFIYLANYEVKFSEFIKRIKDLKKFKRNIFFRKVIKIKKKKYINNNT